MLREALESLVPNPAAALWIGVLIAFVLFGDAQTLRSRKNLALAGMLVLAPLLLHAMGFGATGRGTAPLLFDAIFLCTGAYAAWSFALSRGRGIPGWRPNLTRTGLRALLAFVLVIDVAVALGRVPDDAGIYSNLGARRWAETGVLPYGDPKLKGPEAPAYGAAATYGPLLYAAHLPFQLALRVPSNPPDVPRIDRSYRWPTTMATKLACLAFFVAGLGALFVIVRRLAGEDLALAAVILYAASPYVLGLGGDRFVVGGLAYISHIAPPAVLLLAFAAIGQPFLSGLLMAAAAGVLFWPAFAFPLWLGWRVWRREGAIPFAAGFAVAGLAIAALVVYYTPVPPGQSALRLFLESTLEHQEGVGARQYGASTFSFWGTHPALAAVLQHPLFGTTALFKPMFLAYAALCLAAAYWARQRTMVQLAALTAMLASAIQLWKTHATGTYVEWYLPFLIIALLGGGPGAAPVGESPPQNGR
jgi:hypothetical protein